MGHRGPQPAPTNLKLLRGDRPSRINTDEPTPRLGLPECPPDVADEVREVFAFVVGHLAEMGIVAAVDRDALLCYAEAVVTHRRASRLLVHEGLLLTGRQGESVRNPLVAMQRDAANVIRSLARDFGLTPSARSEIRIGRPAGGSDSAERLLS